MLCSKESQQVTKLARIRQAIWIGFAPIESDVMTEYGVSATFVNFLSMIFMIVPCRDRRDQASEAFVGARGCAEVYLPANFPASYAMDVLGCRWALLVGGCLQTFGAILRLGSM